jgi:hypothetical protein
MTCGDRGLTREPKENDMVVDASITSSTPARQYRIGYEDGMNDLAYQAEAEWYIKGWLAGQVELDRRARAERATG